MKEKEFQKEKRQRTAVLLLLASVLCTVIIATIGSRTDADAKEQGSRFIDNGDGTRTLVYIDVKGVQNKILDFDFRDEEYLIMTGKHNASSARYHYYTKGYYFTGRSTNHHMSAYTGKKVRIDRIAETEDVTSGSTQSSTYRIKWSDIIDAAKKFFTEQELRGSVTIYMSNIFEVRDRDNGDGQIGKDVIDYGVMVNAQGYERCLPGGIQWSESTLNILPAYYDIPIRLEKIIKVTPTPTPTPTPFPIPEDTLEESTDRITYMNPEGRVSLQSDVYEAEEGIPSTEELTVEVTASKYLIDASFVKRSGRKEYLIKVSLPYEITYLEAEKEELTTIKGSVEGAVIVAREYEYTEIDSLRYYVQEKAEIRSDVLADGALRINSKQKIADMDVKCYAKGEKGHLIEPGEKDAVIILPKYTYVAEEGESPELPGITEEHRLVVEGKIGKIMARNDKLAFDGAVVLEDDYVEEKAVKPLLSNLKKPVKNNPERFRERVHIPAKVRNGFHDTDAVLRYTLKASVGTGKSYLEFDDLETNGVHVHTPVVCKGVISEDNSQYVQCFSNEVSEAELVVGRAEGMEAVGHENDSCDFYVSVSNYGHHLNKKGYGTREYLYNAGLNQVRFPFKVHLDVGEDRLEYNDRILEKGTWYTLGMDRVRCYIDEDVKDGVYYADFRTIAVNSDSSGPETQQRANLNEEYYAASDTVKIRVSGKMFGFRLCAIDDEYEWGETAGPFAAGICDELGIPTGYRAEDTLPVINGGNPRFQGLGVQKFGYNFTFCFNTRGSTLTSPGTRIDIIPHFYHVDAEGKNRVEADLYYDYEDGGSHRLVRIGSREDELNRKEDTDLVRTYGRLRLYGMGRDYHFVYGLPKDCHATKKGTDIEKRAERTGVSRTDDCWLRGGYIIVNFEINASSEDGTRIMSYSGRKGVAGNVCCSMWNMEGFLRRKTDFYGKEFEFEEGDVLLISDTFNKSDDYGSKRLN